MPPVSPSHESSFLVILFFMPPRRLVDAPAGPSAPREEMSNAQ